MKLPSKLDYGARTCTAKGVVEKVNEVISFIDYFIRETEKCCTCGGCPKHPNFIATRSGDEPITVKRYGKNWEDEPETLAQKFQAFREKNGSGKGDRYWKKLEAIAKNHYD